MHSVPLPQNPSPAGTPTSTDPSLSRDRRWLSVVKTLLLFVGLGFVTYSFVAAIRKLGGHPGEIRINVVRIVESALLILLAFGVLIAGWSGILASLAGRRIPYFAAARIWFISNLSIYIPAGPGWQILQMGVMSEEQGIGGVPAAAAAVINAAINIATGIAVAVIAGADLLTHVAGLSAGLATTAAIVAGLGVLALPALLPIVLRFARDRMKRDLQIAKLPVAVVLGAAMANVLGWFLYGAALQRLSLGVLGSAPGNVAQYTAAFAAAYAAGYLFFITPGGIGVREIALAGVIVSSALATQPQASVLVVASRLSLIVVQVLPALLFLAYRRRPSDEKSAAGQNSPL